MLLIEEKLFQLHMPQVANIFAAQTGTPVNMDTGTHVTFVVTLGTGGTGTGTFTVNAAPTSSMSGSVAIPFSYRVQATASTTDAFAASTAQATSSGFTVGAGAQQLVFIEVEARSLNEGASAGTNNQYVQLVTAQGVAGSVVGTALAIVSRPKFVGQNPPTTFN